MIEAMKIMFGPSANQVRTRQLETARRELLRAQAELEVLASQVAMYRTRIERLELAKNMTFTRVTEAKKPGELWPMRSEG